jgi:hypothetical protein
LFDLTDARGGYFSLLGFAALVFIVPVLSRVGLFRFIAALLPVFCLGASFYMASLWDNDEANQLLSIRPILFERFLSELTEADVLLSTTVKQFDRAVTIVDNSYLHLLVGGGIVMCVVFCIIYAQAVKNLFKVDRHVEVAFILATCMYFNSESILLRIENMFVIFFWFLILRYCNPLLPSEARLDISPVVLPERPKKGPRIPAWEAQQRARLEAAMTPGRIPEKVRPGRRERV